MSPLAENAIGDDCDAAPPCNTKGIVRAYRQLRMVSEVLIRELGREGKTSPFKPESYALSNCLRFREAWKAFLGTLRGLPGTWVRHIVASYDKGTRSLFDYDCRGCDPRCAKETISSWWDRVSVPGQTPASVLRNLRRYARFVLGTKAVSEWTEEKKRKVFWEGESQIPNGMACLEMTRSKGGTFSAANRRDLDHPGRLRVTSVKSKSKYRVVTCQPGYVKRALENTMTFFYDRLTSRNDWIVRGDITSDHFKTLRRKQDQTFVSGDYSASTDYLHLDAVLEVVAAICEAVDETTADILMKSFRDVECRESEGGAYRKVRRGSMMGSKCSFIVLCIINGFVVDNALGNSDEKGRVDFHSAKLINGDDSAFCGDDRQFDTWKLYAAWVGFRVNLDKTGRDRRFVELNSQVFDSKLGRMIPKPSFGFLVGTKESEVKGEWAEDPWDSLFKTITHGLRRNASRLFLLGHYLVKDALVGLYRPNLLVIPRRWHTWLFKKRWFRSLRCSPEDREVGYTPPDPLVNGPPMSEREIAYTYGPVPRDDETRRIVELAEDAFMIRHKRKWDGVKVARNRRVRLRSEGLPPLMRVGRGPVEGRRLWIRDVLEEIEPIEGPNYYYPLGGDAIIEHRDDDKVVLRRGVIVTRTAQHGPMLNEGWVRLIGDQERYLKYD